MKIPHPMDKLLTVMIAYISGRNILMSELMQTLQKLTRSENVTLIERLRSCLLLKYCHYSKNT